MGILSALFAVVFMKIEGAVSEPDQHWNVNDCKALATEESCTSVGWCFWSKTAAGTAGCDLDGCLKVITSTNDPSCTSTCQAFYFTNETQCDGTVKPSDLFCQVKATTNVDTSFSSPSYFDYCFWQMLNLSIPYVPSESDGSGGNAGSYPCQTTGGLCQEISVDTQSGRKRKVCVATDKEDCKDFTGDNAAFCDCLGEKNCALSPYCMKGKNAAGQSACVLDLCTKEFNQSTDCTGYKCKKMNMNYYDKSSGTWPFAQLCVNQSRDGDTTTPNECYLLQNVDSDCSDGDPKALCEGGRVTDKSGVNTADNCQYVPIAPGIIGASNYCTDGREVPAPVGSRSVHKDVSYFLSVLILSALALFL